MTPPPSPSGERRLWRIEHAGAATAVGSSAWQSAASWVGLQKRFRKNTVPGLGTLPLTLAPCPEVAGAWPVDAATPMFTPSGEHLDERQGPTAPPACAPHRIARLLAAALVDLLTQTQPATPATWPQCAVLALPAWLSAPQAQDLWRQSLALLQEQGGRQEAQALARLPLHVVRSGQTASFEALDQLNRCGSDVRNALLLAADSWMDPVLLQRELAANALLSDSQPDGFVAGEAAAALWLRSVPDTTADSEHQWVLHSPAHARSAHAHRDTAKAPDPEALTQAFRSALHHAHWKPEHVGCSLSDSDGSSWRASAEVGAAARAMDGQGPDEWQPASFVGQIGAATGAVHWALAVQRLRHDEKAPNSILSWALDAGDLTAAVALERSIYNEQALAAKAHTRPHRGGPDTAGKTFSARFLSKKT